MRFKGKIIISLLAVAVLLVIMTLGGLMGSRSGELHLAGDYYFSFFRNNLNFISAERGEIDEIVISSKVEEFFVRDNQIFVTRRPLQNDEMGRGGYNFRLTNTCEYFRIDVSGRKVYGPFSLAEVKNRREWLSLQKAWANPDFGKTLCKLSSVWK